MVIHVPLPWSDTDPDAAGFEDPKQAESRTQSFSSVASWEDKWRE